MKLNTSTSGTAATASEENSVGLKHILDGDAGPARSMPVKRTATASPLSCGPQFENPSSNMEESESKLREKSRSQNVMKELWRNTHLPESPMVYFWIFLFGLLFIILTCPGMFHPLDSSTGPVSMARSSRKFQIERSGIGSIDNCRGRRVYMYNLPPQFNIAVRNESRCRNSLIPWVDLCNRFDNAGFGVELRGPSEPHSAGDGDDFDRSQWFQTDFFMLEVIFHSRMKKYRCLTDDSSEADALYIPSYTGLVALDYLYGHHGGRPYEERRLYGKELIDWLDNNGGKAWRKYGGRDSFLIAGRTTWDFRLREEWGTGFSALPHVANMTTLILERLAPSENEIAVPYPTTFHPGSPERLNSWIEGVKSAERKYLFTYVGAPRSESWSVRGIMTSSCINAGKSVCNVVDCSVLECSHDPVPAYQSFLHSNFCLQPRGDTATRRSTFDCLISGAIPVFFHMDSAYTQYSWHLPREAERYSVYIDEEDLKKGTSIQDVLMSYSQERIDEMRRTIVSIIPSLLYFDKRKDTSWNAMNGKEPKDAFDVILERLLERSAAAKESFNQGTVHHLLLPDLESS